MGRRISQMRLIIIYVNKQSSVYEKKKTETSRVNEDCAKRWKGTIKIN